MDDETCFQHLRQGGPQAEKAVGVLYQRYRQRFAAYLMRTFRFPEARVEDVIQEAFRKLIQHLRKQGAVPAQTDGGRAWLWTILRSAALESMRKADARHLVLETTPEQENGMLPLEDAACVRRAWRAFAADHPERAEALERAVLEEWNTAELAAFLNRSAGATREYVSQCRKVWRGYWERLCGSSLSTNT